MILIHGSRGIEGNGMVGHVHHRAYHAKPVVLMAACLYNSHSPFHTFHCSKSKPGCMRAIHEGDAGLHLMTGYTGG
jgi:hypothetical protein